MPGVLLTINHTKVGGLVSFYREIKEITDHNKKIGVEKVQEEVLKEAKDIIEKVKDKVTESAERGKETVTVKIGWGKPKNLYVEIDEFRIQVIKEVEKFFTNEGFKIWITDDYGWIYGIYTVHMEW